MKTPVFIYALLLFAAGCMSSAPEAPTNWTIEWKPSSGHACAASCGKDAKLLHVDVRSPYNGTRLTVLRKDGSVAFDAFNVFADRPAALLKGAALDVLTESRAFKRILAAASSAYAPVNLELTVTRLALDCRKEDERLASVALTLTAIANRTVIAASSAEASEPVSDGEGFSRPFSKAFSDALASAVKSLHTGK